MATATLEKKTSITQTLSDIAEAVERIKNDAPQQFPEAASIGDAVRQGDIYIQLISESDLDTMKYLYNRVDTPVLQLAPGNTKGSRHVLESADGVEMYLPADTDEAVMRYVFAKHGEKLPAKRTNGQFGWSGQYFDERKEVEAALTLAGPIVRLTKPNAVTHPEHGDWKLPCGTYRIVFQRTVDEQERIRRVLD